MDEEEDFSYADFFSFSVVSFFQASSSSLSLFLFLPTRTPSFNIAVFVCSLPQKDEPPEITYCVVNQNGMMHLQTLSPAQPMPEESELDAKFTELLVRETE